MGVPERKGIIGFVRDSQIIQVTRTAMGLSPRPLPIAPDKPTISGGLQGSFNDVLETGDSANHRSYIDGDFYPDP